MSVLSNGDSCSDFTCVSSFPSFFRQKSGVPSTFSFISFVSVSVHNLHQAFHLPAASASSGATRSSCSCSLQWEHQEAGEGGELPSSHQVPSFQFEVGPVSLLHLDQNSVAGGFACHVLVSSKRRDHRPAVVYQAHLEQEEEHKHAHETTSERKSFQDTLNLSEEGLT